MSDAIGIPSAVSEPKRRAGLADFFIRLWREKPLGTVSGIIILILINVHSGKRFITDNTGLGDSRRHRRLKSTPRRRYWH